MTQYTPTTPEIRLTRRAALTAAAILPAALPMVVQAQPSDDAAFIAACRSSTRQNHPDALLLAAWVGFVEAHRAFDHVCAVPPLDNAPDADHEPYYQVIDFYRARIEKHQASTVAGLAVQLRYLFVATMETMTSFRAAVYGEPVNEELAAMLNDDYRARMLWDMAQAATRASQATPF